MSLQNQGESADSDEAVANVICAPPNMTPILGRKPFSTVKKSIGFNASPSRTFTPQVSQNGVSVSANIVVFNAT